jgi:hypothetical protein
MFALVFSAASFVGGDEDFTWLLMLVMYSATAKH